MGLGGERGVIRGAPLCPPSCRREGWTLEENGTRDSTRAREPAGLLDDILRVGR